MSLPSFDIMEKIPNREKALNAIISSIAMEEIALANIMDAESKKLNYVIQNIDIKCKQNMNMLLKFNESVDSLVGNILDMQIILKNKLKMALFHLKEYDSSCNHPCSCDTLEPEKPKEKECFAIFKADSRYRWSAGKTLFLEEDMEYSYLNICCIKSKRKCADNYILLPANKNFRIEIEFNLFNHCKGPVIIELKHEQSNDIILSKKYNFNDNKNIIKIYDKFDIKRNFKKESFLSFSLLSENNLKLDNAIVKIISIH